MNGQKLGANDQYSFAVCLSHDVDRVYKTYQYPYRFVKQLDVSELLGMFSSKNPYWQFERIMAIESDLGVRSSFNALDEIPLRDRPKSEWVKRSGWMLYAGRYDVTDPQVSTMLKVLDDHGWEIGLQGSYTSSRNPRRFGYEKNRIESATGTEIVGNRQHHLRLSRPTTWRHLRDHGLKYDMSLGDETELEFQHGYELIRPFNDEFIVFPWTLMDCAVMGAGESAARIWSKVESVLDRVKRERSVVVVDWHQRVFHESEFVDWGAMYRRLVEKAVEMGAWVGPPGQFYEATAHPDGTVERTLSTLADANTSAVYRQCRS